MDYGKLAYLKAEELEKLIKSNGKNNNGALNCFEIKKNNLNQEVLSNFVYSFGEINAEENNNVCFFINANFVCEANTNITLKLLLNESVIATTTKTANLNNTSIFMQSVSSTMASGKKELKLEIIAENSVILSGVSLIAINASTSNETTNEMEVKASLNNSDLAISFVKDNKIYYALCSTTLPEFNPENFTMFKNAISHDVVFNLGKQNNPLTFAYIDENKDLYISTLNENGDIFVDSGVSSVAIENNGDESEGGLVVIYASGGKVYYKTLINNLLGQKNELKLPESNFVSVRKFFSEEDGIIYIVATDDKNNNFVCNSIIPISANNLSEHLYCTLNMRFVSLEDEIADKNHTISSLSVDVLYGIICKTVIDANVLSMTDISNININLDMELNYYDVPNDAIFYGMSFDMHGEHYDDGVLGAVYYGDCANFTPATITLTNGTPVYDGGSWDNVWPFNQIKPCLKNGDSKIYLNPNNLTESADGTQTNLDIYSGNSGDVFVEIPKIYYRFYKTDEDVL
ncbi:MAG: hypothetical protein IJT25_01685, partial [Clostridia bacterium]|nr:hypothetical protein [Clostridia bacterium]